jgi:hypothetical protein
MILPALPVAAFQVQQAAQTAPTREDPSRFGDGGLAGNEVQQWLLTRSIPIPEAIPGLTTTEAPPPAASGGSSVVASSKNAAKAGEQPKLDLTKFEVRRFELTIEPAPKPVSRTAPVTAFDDRLFNKNDVKTEKPKVEIEPTTSVPDVVLKDHRVAPEIAKPEAPLPSRPVPEPPIPAPTARRLYMDIGDADSQVRVVIREHNGDLQLRFDTSSERLRHDLETASPTLVENLERNAIRVSDLDFTAFGSATDAEHQQQGQPQPKKSLKSEAAFAELDETAYPGDAPVSSMSL